MCICRCAQNRVTNARAILTHIFEMKCLFVFWHITAIKIAFAVLKRKNEIKRCEREAKWKSLVVQILQTWHEILIENTLSLEYAILFFPSSPELTILYDLRRCFGCCFILISLNKIFFWSFLLFLPMIINILCIRVNFYFEWSILLNWRCFRGVSFQ